VTQPSSPRASLVVAILLFRLTDALRTPNTLLWMLGLIFDCDGVLVDSEALSCGAWLPVLARRGIAAELMDILPFIGKSDRAVREHFSRQSGIEVESDATAEWQAEYFSVARGNVATFPGLLALLRIVERRHTRLAVASSGPPAKIRFNLEQAGLTSHFGVVVSALEVAQGKPAPDLFLLAAARLGLAAADCAVVEDSVFGIQAARRAGMMAIGFCSSHPEPALRDAGADHVFHDYAALAAMLEASQPAC
jgi:HAD superfamily hydrolase (TIGR01509 family)